VLLLVFGAVVAGLVPLMLAIVSIERDIALAAQQVVDRTIVRRVL
jgi:uncharacterized membrane protein YdfJ with MMPL/SSD domain